MKKGNVANQREHLILLLANIDSRNKTYEDSELLDNNTVDLLMDKIFKNYRSWCAYLHCPSNIMFPHGSARQQLELIYIGLFLLIWGEASNIRFMPECICYIFHKDVSGLMLELRTLWWEAKDVHSFDHIDLWIFYRPPKESTHGQKKSGE